MFESSPLERCSWEASSSLVLPTQAGCSLLSTCCHSSPAAEKSLSHFKSFTFVTAIVVVVEKKRLLPKSWELFTWCGLSWITALGGESWVMVKSHTNFNIPKSFLLWLLSHPKFYHFLFRGHEDILSNTQAQAYWLFLGHFLWDNFLGFFKPS